MNLSTWATSPAWTAAGWTMLHFLWIGAALAILAAIGRRPLRQAHPDVRHAYALATLAALALAPAAIAWTIADASRTAVATPKGSTATISPPIASAPATPTPSRALARFEPPHEASFHSSVIIYLNVAAKALPGVWLVGAPWTFAYLAAGLLGAERLRRRSRVVGDADLSAVSARLAGSLGIARRVTVGVCDRIAGPMLLGIARPLILLPASALSGWSPEQVEMALLHELAHVRRWDNLVSLLQRVVESALFFHPAVWIVSGWVRLEREHCCDRIVVDRTGRALDYAGALFVLADAPAPPFAHGAFMARNHLVDRIRRILNPEEPAMRLSRSAVALAASTLAVPAILLAAYAQQPSPQSAEGKAKPSVPEFRRPRGSSEYMKKAAVKPDAGPWEPGPIPESISANVSGVARNEQGGPVAGASLTLYAIANDDMRMRSAAATVSDASGRYQFRNARLSVQTSFNGHPFPREQTPYASFFIYGRAPGMGVAWSKHRSIYAVKNPHPNDIQGRLPLGAPATLDLTFAKAAVLQGKVVDERGDPIAGAKVGVGNAISLDAEGRETGNHQGYSWNTLPDGVGRTTTGADGGFRLEGLSERFCYYVSVSRPESPKTMLSLRAATIDGPDATHDEPPMGPDYGPQSHQARTNPITVVFPKPRPIDVSVVGDDGKPIAGAEILLSGPWWSGGFGSGGTADATGKIRLGLPPGEYATVGSSPPKNTTYLSTNQGPLVVEAGDAPLSLEIRQKRGVELVLEAVEAGTGKPIPDIYFWRSIDDLPDQKVDPNDDLVQLLSTNYTNERGESRVLAKPSPGRRYRFFFGGVRKPNSGGFAPGAPEKNGYEATPAQSEPVELIPGKPIRLRFELSKPKPAAAENRQPKQEDQPLAIADARLSAQVEARIRDLFMSDPAVAELIQDITATRHELGHAKSVHRRSQDPARKAAERHLDQLNAKYRELWIDRYAEIRQRVLAEPSKTAAREPDPISATILAAYFQKPNRPAPAVNPPSAIPEYRQSRRSRGIIMTKVAGRADDGWQPGTIPATVSVRVSGVARDEQGEPVAGARLRLYASTPNGVTPSPVTTTDARGRYEIADAVLPVRAIGNQRSPFVDFTLCGRGPGVGIMWSDRQSIPILRNHVGDGLAPSVAPVALDMTFPKAAVLEGKVVDEEGRPIAGARIEVANVDMLDALGRETGNAPGLALKDCSEGVGEAVADAAGSFRMEGLPDRACFEILVHRPGIAPTYSLLSAATIPGPDTIHNKPGTEVFNGRAPHAVRTNPITVVFPKLRMLAVRVVGDDDGKPLPSVNVSLSGNTPNGASYGCVGNTDAEGKALLGMPCGVTADIRSVPPGGSRHLETRRRLLIDEGEAPLPCEIRQKAGAEVILEAVEAGTGRPLPGVGFWRIPDDQPDRKETVGDVLLELDETWTDERGEFRALFPPEPGRRYRFEFAGILDPGRNPLSPTPWGKHGFEASPARSEPVELVPGKPIRLRFELRKGEGS